MIPDIPTLVLANLMISTFLCAAMLFYRKSQHTYAGFGFWSAGVCSVIISYLSILLRGTVPTPISIFCVNFFLALGLVLRLDGTLLFLRGKRLDRRLYGAPLILMILVLYFYWGRDSIVARNLIASSFSFLVLMASAALFFSYKTRGKCDLCGVIGLLHLLGGALLMTRALLWMTQPEYGLLGPGFIHSLYFFGVMILDTGIVIGYLMMNSQRLEKNLVESRKSLDQTHQELMKTMSEIKILSGLLPICTYCKKVRDDKGYWQQIEMYVRDRTNADFSHSICPECMTEHYPAVAERLSHKGDTPAK